MLIYKAIPNALRQLDGRARVIQFIASREERDLEGDVLVAEGVDTSAFFARGPGPLLADHDVRSPVGKVVAINVDVVNGVPSLIGVAEVDPPGTSPEADTVWRQLASGSRRGISVGFLPLDIEPLREGGRLIRRSRLLEISLVVLPAVPSAQVTAVAAVKALGAPTGDEEAALEILAALKGMAVDLGRHEIQRSLAGLERDLVALKWAESVRSLEHAALFLELALLEELAEGRA